MALHEAMPWTSGQQCFKRRPGDTIILEPGAAHAIKDVTVQWPLRLMGGGKAAEDTSLFCMLGAKSAFEFRCVSVLVYNPITNSFQDSVLYCFSCQ